MTSTHSGRPLNGFTQHGLVSEINYLSRNSRVGATEMTPEPKLPAMHTHLKWSGPTPTTSGDMVRSNRVAFGRLSLKIRVRPTQNQKSKVEGGHKETFWKKGFLLIPHVRPTARFQNFKVDFPFFFFTNRIDLKMFYKIYT